MKLITFQNYSSDELSVVLLSAPNQADQFAQIVAKELRNIAAHARTVEQYSTFFLGHILSDEGMVVAESETLSVDDDHDRADDLDYFHDRMEETEAKFGSFCWYENGMLTVLFFGE